MSREQHAADWSAYIEQIGAMRWDVIFNNRHHSSWATRELARVAMRCVKIDRAARELGGYPILSKEAFDAICARLRIDPDDDALVDRLVKLGWVFNPFDDEYIGPERLDSPEGWSPSAQAQLKLKALPKGRWGSIRDGWLEEDVQEAMAARARIRECFRASMRHPLMKALEDDDG